ncbi:MAG: ABC transporter permease [Bryobacterales bacterium]|nr:ABC transporter permease [Bryobacterales bacterium]
MALPVTQPVWSLWRNRGLIRTMVFREIQARYRGSLADMLWTVLHPLLLMAVYFFVFGIVLRARFEADPSPAGFVLYFFAGMLPWLAFSEAVGRAPFVLLEGRTLIKKIRFPMEILPANPVFAGLLTQAIATVIYLIALAAIRGGLPITVLCLPVLLVPQILFTLGLCWLLAALGLFLRDLGQMIGFLLTLWFFLTPICYPEASLPQWAVRPLSYSPIYQLVRGYRAILLESRLPDALPALALWAAACLTALAGYFVFQRLRPAFADIV